jgi:formimidoylglutamate deiminase
MAGFRAIHRVRCEQIWLDDGWAREQLVEITAEGLIAGVGPAGEASVDLVLTGPVIPGMPNLHSHSHQRVLAGLTETRTPGKDDFWGWRDLMYRANRAITPDDLESIARCVFIEMVKQGYTVVAEFHYLHHAPGGDRYAQTDEMSQRLWFAAEDAGISLVLLPVLYTYGGFGQQPLKGAQKRFYNTLEDYLILLDKVRKSADGAANRGYGLAAHSLRAVAPEQLATLDRISRADHSGIPFHIHVAEQLNEVDECIALLGARPVEWLCREIDVDHRWCFIHATHVSGSELEVMAESGVVVGLCPTTEANLGDGLFPATEFVALGGRFGIGSDSQVCSNPAREFQLLEYGQRLKYHRRALVMDSDERHNGNALVHRAVAGGGQACGRSLTGIAVGAPADLIELDPDSPRLALRSADEALDSWIFSASDNSIRTVIAMGREVVTEGRHTGETVATEQFLKTLKRLTDRSTP